MYVYINVDVLCAQNAFPALALFLLGLPFHQRVAHIATPFLTFCTNAISLKTVLFSHAQNRFKVADDTDASCSLVAKQLPLGLSYPLVVENLVVLQ